MFKAESGSLEALELRFNSYHEAGHAVAFLKGRYPSVPDIITVIPDGNRGGYVAGRMNGEDHNFKEYSEARVVCLVAGRTTERILAGITSGFDGSTGGDVEKAREILKTLETRSRERRAWMKSLVAESKTLIETNWELVEAVAEALMAEGKIDGNRFMEIVDRIDPEEGANWLSFEEQVAKVSKSDPNFKMIVEAARRPSDA